jgi:hypothetical protein
MKGGVVGVMREGRKEERMSGRKERGERPPKFIGH